jgi:hypothetical protein
VGDADDYARGLAVARGEPLADVEGGALAPAGKRGRRKQAVEGRREGLALLLGKERVELEGSELLDRGMGEVGEQGREVTGTAKRIGRGQPSGSDPRTAKRIRVAEPGRSQPSGSGRGRPSGSARRDVRQFLARLLRPQYPRYPGEVSQEVDAIGSCFRNARISAPPIEVIFLRGGLTQPALRS